MQTTIRNGRVLLPDGEIARTGVVLEDGRILSVGGAPDANGREIDARDLLVLPGIVDIHGDAFERQLMPRPGVHFDTGLGLLDSDRQILANGITTAFHGVTSSWEPGLRGREAMLDFLRAFDEVRPLLGCETLLHLRYETYNLDAVDEVEGWLAEGRVQMLGFNEHLALMTKNLDRYEKMSVYLNRTGLDRGDFIALLDGLRGRAGEVSAGIERLAAAARAHGVPMASHDDPDPETRRWFHDIGCRISEFPVDRATAEASVAMGDPVVLGAPNALRGKSHDKRITASEAVAAGLCGVLTSDYYYPAQLQAAFVLAAGDPAALGRCWELVSGGPARAAGLDDRGAIEPGKRADMVFVDDSVPRLPRAVATFVAGRPVFDTVGLGLLA